ncbi:MAG TPA: peptidoglycan-binding domain-containing protein [Candidatus Acidoferrales bacterium]|nr:peptidoglycan-binding domain-containing protein [Candidatus Acidoferrales bacterium]
MLRFSDISLPGRATGGGPGFLFSGSPRGGGFRPPLFCLFALAGAVLLCGARPAAAQSKAKPVRAQSRGKSAHAHHTAGKRRSRAVHRQMAPQPERIMQIQSALSREGFYHGESTGKWDEASAAAMKNFQQARGLPATGKIEALSLQKLGLGSPVAGMAAPAPPPSSAAPPPGPAGKP